MVPLLRPLYLLVFLTGAAGLIYQVVWQQYLARILGSESVRLRLSAQPRSLLFSASSPIPSLVSRKTVHSSIGFAPSFL